MAWFFPRNYWSLLDHDLMTSIWETAISILAGNLNSGHSYLITAVKVSRNAQFNFVLWGCTKLKLSLKLCTLSLRETREKGDRWAGWAIAHPDLGTSVNPIATKTGGRGVDCAPHITTCPPDFQTFRHPCREKGARKSFDLALAHSSPLS